MDFEYLKCPHCHKSIKIALPRPSVSFVEKPTEKEIKDLELG